MRDRCERFRQGGESLHESRTCRGGQIDLRPPTTSLHRRLERNGISYRWPLAAGRKTKTSSADPRRSSSPAPTAAGEREDTQQIREWAAANGHQVNSRDQVEKEIVDACQTAHA